MPMISQMPVLYMIEYILVDSSNDVDTSSELVKINICMHLRIIRVLLRKSLIVYV
jgi:hypothetical protein